MIQTISITLAINKSNYYTNKSELQKNSGVVNRKKLVNPIKIHANLIQKKNDRIFKTKEKNEQEKDKEGGTKLQTPGLPGIMHFQTIKSREPSGALSGLATKP